MSKILSVETEAFADARATATVLGDGLMSGAALRELGVGAHAFGVLVRSGELVCVRRGIYVDGSEWSGAGSDGRYRIFLRATAMSARTPQLLSHLSAAAMHALPIIGNWPRTAHVLTPDAGGGSSSTHLSSHRSGPPDAGIMIDGCAVTTLARTIVDVAATESFLVAVTMCDSALCRERARARGLTAEQLAVHPVLSRAALYEELERVNPGKGRRRAERAIAFSTELSESAGESLSRVRIHELGYEVPELQEPFVDLNGDDRRVDFFWRRIRKIGEFDGEGKYLRGVPDGGRFERVAEWVLKEKRREDALRPLVGSFTRWDWGIAISPTLFHRFLGEHGVPHAR